MQLNSRVVAAAALLSLGLLGCKDTFEPPTPRATTMEAMTSTNATGVVATEVSPAPRVRVADQDGRPMEGIEVLFRFAGIAPTPTDNRTVSVLTDINGLAGVSWSLGTVVGEYRVTAESPELATVVTFTATARPGAATAMTLMNAVLRAPAGTQLSFPLSIGLRDVFGNAVPGALVTFSVMSGGGSIEGGTVLTNAAGVATSGVWTLGMTPGNQHVRATAAGVTLDIPAEAYILPPCDAACADAGVIAFSRGVNLHVTDVQGSAVVQLTIGSEPAWSPDGRRLAFMRSVQVGSTMSYFIHVMAADGDRSVQRIGNAGFSPAWSPDGRHIAYNRYCGNICISVMSAETGALSLERLGTLNGANRYPSWSPDGTRIAFVSDYANISVAAADGSSITQLTTSPSNLETVFYPTWSPDGATIAFVHGRVINEGSVWRFSVRVMNADGTNVRVLASAGDTDPIEGSVPGSISWSPDGGRIAFTAFTTIDRSIRYVTLDGALEGLIVANGQDPSWKR